MPSLKIYVGIFWIHYGDAAWVLINIWDEELCSDNPRFIAIDYYCKV